MSVASPDELDLHRVTDADHARVDVDLDAAGLPLLGQELRVREARADHQQRVAALHHRVARLGPEQADRARHEGQVVRHRRFAEQRLRDACAQHVGGLDHLLGRAHGTLADEHRDALA